MNKFPDFYQERKSLYAFDGFQSFSGDKKGVLENCWSGSENNLSRQKSNFLPITVWHCALTNPESMKVELSFKHHKGAIQFKISLSFFFFFFKRAVSLLHCKLDNVCHQENQWHPWTV